MNASMLTESAVTDGELRLAQHRQDATQAQKLMISAMADLQRAQNNLLSSRMDEAISLQRRVEEETLIYSKNVSSLYQRATKWKSEQKRFQACLQGLESFEEWAPAVEMELQGIASNLEYVCAVLDRDASEQAAGSGQQAQ